MTVCKQQLPGWIEKAILGLLLLLNTTVVSAQSGALIELRDPFERMAAPHLVEPVALSSDSISSKSWDIAWSAYAAPKWSPGARLLGPWTGVPSAGGLSYATGVSMIWGMGRWQGQADMEHWRVGGVHENDWNQAYHWGVWDGLGRAWNPNQTDLSTARLTGSMSFRVSPSVIIDAGQENHHWGAGWRSLWLDRQAAALPFARLQAQAGSVHYTHLIARTNHLSVGTPPTLPQSGQDYPGAYAVRRGSWMAAHLVEVEFGGGWQGALFGAVTWLNKDSSYTQRFEAAYALPFIAFRPTEYALGSADNVLMGASLRYDPIWAKKQLRVHAQILLDEFVAREITSDANWWANKWGALISVQFKSRNNRWKGVLETSAVRPYTYAHASSAQSYTHQRRPIAHPLGSNFIEWRGHLQWQKLPWSIHLGAQVYQHGMDESVPWGEDPAISIGANPLLSYTTRPADYGVSLIWDGDIPQAGIQKVTRFWLDVSYAIPKLHGQSFFVRTVGRLEQDAQADPTWWRIETGLRLNRMFEERDW